jgi:hypothetical protein
MFMTMTFQAKVKNSTIAIHDKKRQITKESFKPFLNTSNWKFNREEANER